MSAPLVPSPACCRVAPPAAPAYEPKGVYVDENGMKTYETGPATPTRALLLIYDIFGLYPQTLRGADMLAEQITQILGQATKVIMPDWFGDNPADITQYPPDTPEKVEYINNFFNDNASPDAIIPQIPGIVKAVGEKNPSVEGWGIMGHCWGGKIAALVSAEGTAFKVAAQCHPSLLDPADADVVTVPMMVLPSGDEDVPTVKEFEKRLKEDKYVETFPDRVHGWMASKADFEDVGANADFHRGYKLLSEWFAKHL
ncbi:dienelactone hydrolase family protein [Aulographum hederae CBS 113979]|uniref:Dienelactone hydrolase family protein n=1 Tax=Aulographum hederae CBS 113979 TaxID=1176131 RepID=A0A6G1H681_9PEZI|nr:dienelactone hydrolase family protein [Aulographum hederae CBS 113979]